MVPLLCVITHTHILPEKEATARGEPSPFTESQKYDFKLDETVQVWSDYCKVHFNLIIIIKFLRSYELVTGFLPSQKLLYIGRLS